MTPAQLSPTSFANYPSQARTFAVSQLALLQSLPLIFAAILLREISTYDWRFPAERDALLRQLTFLGKLSVPKRYEFFTDLRAIAYAPELEATEWVDDPGAFLEKLTASLWSTHNMDAFRAFATSYQRQIDNAVPAPLPGVARLGIVVYDPGGPMILKPLFARLSRYGVTFTAIKQTDGWPALLEYASLRVKSGTPGIDTSFKHWYIDGGVANDGKGLVPISYDGIGDARKKLLNVIQRGIGSGTMGPEELRSALARMKPADVGLPERGDESILNHFKLSVLTEGSGTQIFSTTFTQWAARECIRRAEPETLLVRFRPRQSAVGMDQMLTPGFASESDPKGSLIDSQMGAYYTWINLRRLSGSEHLRFLVWQRDSSQALLIGPGLPKGTSSDSPLNIRQLLDL
jgi:hypothetical protein